MKVCKRNHFVKGIFFLFLCMILLGGSSVKAETKTKIEKLILEPVEIKTGSEEEIKNSSYYDFESDGITLVPLVISCDATLVMEVQTETPGFAILEMYTSKENEEEMPEYYSCRCVREQEKTDVVITELKKGTYYIKFPKNNYHLSARLFKNIGRKLKDTDLVSGYCNHLSPSEFEFKASKNGYISLEIMNLKYTDSSSIVTLCDTNETELTTVTVRDILQPKTASYVVKKGNQYKIKVYALDVNGKNFYQIKTKFVGKTNQGGASKKKATKVTYGEKGYGIAFAEEANKKADWFKITVPIKQRVKFSCTSTMSSGSLLVDIYDTEGKLLVKEYVIETNDTKDSFELRNRNGTTNLNKGTYYICVSKASKQTAGFYTIRLSKYEVD